MTRTTQGSTRVVNEGLRAWLMETGLRLEGADLTDAHASSAVRGSLIELLRTEAALAEAQEEKVFPRLMERVPYLICHFEQEHRQIAALRQEVLDAETCSRHFASAEQAVRLRLAYTSYMIFVLQHGMREEGVLAGFGMMDMNEGGLKKTQAKVVKMGVAA